MSAEVRAGGGVVLDPEGRVALVHRPRYDDWTLPKGKLDRGESFEDAAVREVEEETGMRCRLVRELPSSEYLDPKGRSKLVEQRGRRAALGPGRRGARAAHLRARRRDPGLGVGL